MSGRRCSQCSPPLTGRQWLQLFAVFFVVPVIIVVIGPGKDDPLPPQTDYSQFCSDAEVRSAQGRGDLCDREVFKKEQEEYYEQK